MSRSRLGRLIGLLPDVVLLKYLVVDAADVCEREVAHDSSTDVDPLEDARADGNRRGDVLEMQVARRWCSVVHVGDRRWRKRRLVQVIWAQETPELRGPSCEFLLNDRMRVHDRGRRARNAAASSENVDRVVEMAGKVESLGVDGDRVGFACVFVDETAVRGLELVTPAAAQATVYVVTPGG